MLSIGCSLDQATKVFILPTPPKGDYLVDEYGRLVAPDLANVINQDGNHWRKILTIMAKLCVSGENWRDYRDKDLLQTTECILFNLPEVFDRKTVYFICGGKMQADMKQMKELTSLDDKNLLKVHNNIILCPYPDYRQFPNRLIELNLAYLNQVSL